MVRIEENVYLLMDKSFLLHGDTERKQFLHEITYDKVMISGKRQLLLSFSNVAFGKKQSAI